MKTAEKSSIFRRRAETHAKPAPIARERSIQITGAAWQVGLALTGFIFVAYAIALWHRGFGPELAMFYLINSDLSWSDMIGKYTSFHNQWYRPTAFHLMYWLGSQLFAWNNILGWKLLQIATLIAACWMQYRFTLEFLGDRKLAAWISAIFVAVFPGQITIILQTSAFDLPHIFFALLSTIWFSRALRIKSARKWIWIAASCASYAAALTSKESTFVLPVFLTVLMLMRSPKRDWTVLIPHFVLLALYVHLHIMQMPSRGAEDAYRTGFNLSFILKNLWSFPLWTARFFALTAHHDQTAAYNNAINNAAGLATLALTVRYWLREHKQRTTLLLMLAWIAITIALPIYSGAYLWHVNLAFCGYAVLASAALADFAIEASRRLSPTPRQIAVAMTGILLLLGVYGVFNTLYAGVHSAQYKMIAGLHSDSSRLPVALSKDTLVYIEDRNHMGTWSYGGGDNLIKFYYMLPKLEEKSVPTLEQLSWETRYEWLRRPNAVFLRYDDNMRWYDGSKDLRTGSISVLTQYTNKLVADGNWLPLIALLESVFREPEARNDYLLQYHYAFALHNCNRISDAIAAYSKSIEAKPDYYYTLLNRGNAFRQKGDREAACSDYRRAAATPGALPDSQDTVRKYCIGTR